MHFNCDCHVHTRRSFCGADDVTVEALVDLMPERGIKRFAVTTVPTFTSMVPSRRGMLILCWTLTNLRRVMIEQPKLSGTILL